MAKEVPPINTYYDVVLHAAGKAHTVPKTEEEKQVFYDVNYIGTIHLCDALEKAGIPSDGRITTPAGCIEVKMSIKYGSKDNLNMHTV